MNGELLTADNPQELESKLTGLQRFKTTDGKLKSGVPALDLEGKPATVEVLLSKDGNGKDRYYTAPVYLSESGNLAVHIDAVTAKDGKYHRFYVRRYPINRAGVDELVPDEGDLVEHINYAYDLDARGKVRNELMTPVLAAEMKPSDAIEKAVKNLVASGMFTREDARQLVVSQRQAKGLPVDDPKAA